MDAKKNTIQRQLVSDAVKTLNCHANAEQVYEHVIAKYPSISKATVYRNLNHMAESGELLRIRNLDDSCRYDHNCHNHYHFICEACGRVFDVEEYFPDICSRVRKTDGFEITHHNVTFSGICSNCKNSNDTLV